MGGLGEFDEFGVCIGLGWLVVRIGSRAFWGGVCVGMGLRMGSWRCLFSIFFFSFFFFGFNNLLLE